MQLLLKAVEKLYLLSVVIVWYCFLTSSQESIVTFVRSQETPTLNVPRWSIDKIFKTNLCQRQQLLNNGEVTLDRALSGLNISVALTLYESPTERQYFDLKEDAAGVPRIKRHGPGLYVRVLDELAERAGFEWRYSFASIAPIDPSSDPSDEGKTWTDLLTWELDVYDVSVDFWMKAVSRMRVGVYFPAGFLDSSLILIEPPLNVKSSATTIDRLSMVAENASIWAFLEPFEASVWLLIALAIFCTGFLYWILERLDDDILLTSKESSEEDENYLTGLSDATFFTAVTFSQHFQFNPRSNSTRLLSFSWAFWAVIVGSAYLANLASFLVKQHQIQYASLTMDRIIEEQHPLCVHATSLPDVYLSRVYPSANFVRKFREYEMFESLLNDECSAAVLSLNVWQLYERNAAYNPGCKLKFNGNFIKINPGCFATSMDSDEVCSSLLGFVFDYHFSTMKADGTLGELWTEHLDNVGSQQCEAAEEKLETESLLTNATALTTPESDDLQIQQLTVSDLGGIFLLHAVFSIVALFVAFLGFFVRSKQGTQQKLILENMLIGMRKGRKSYGADEAGPNAELVKSRSFESKLDKAPSRVSMEKAPSIRSLAPSGSMEKASSRRSLGSSRSIDLEDIEKPDLEKILSTARRISTEGDADAEMSNDASGRSDYCSTYAGDSNSAVASFVRHRKVSMFNAL